MGQRPLLKMLNKCRSGQVQILDKRTAAKRDTKTYIRKISASG